MQDQSPERQPILSPQSKCMAIPQHIVFFCKQLYAEVLQKFPERAHTVLAEFLFGRWLMRELCIDANKNGLITEFPLTGFLELNMLTVKDALTGLLSSEDDY